MILAVAIFLVKRTMSLCVEMKEKFNEGNWWITDEHFAQKLILCQMGWCAKQMLQKINLNYQTGEELVKKVYLLEF